MMTNITSAGPKTASRTSSATMMTMNGLHSVNANASTIREGLSEIRTTVSAGKASASMTGREVVFWTTMSCNKLSYYQRIQF